MTSNESQNLAISQGDLAKKDVQYLQDTVNLALHNGWKICQKSAILYLPQDKSNDWAVKFIRVLTPDGTHVFLPHWIEQRMIEIEIDKQQAKARLQQHEMTVLPIQDCVSSVRSMHRKFGHTATVAEFDVTRLKKLFEFRIAFLQEELTELQSAKTAEDVVDALVDLWVVVVGTLDLFSVDVDEAWNRVARANHAKVRGENAKRSQGTGLPDLVKPEGWVAPNHEGNVGRFSELFTLESQDANSV